MTAIPGPFPVILSAGAGPLAAALNAAVGPLPIEPSAGVAPLAVISQAGAGPLPVDGAGIPPPVFSINFIANPSIPSWITFARTGNATYFDGAGNLQTAATGVPRFSYDPTTLAARGLLSEGAATNLIRNNTMVGASAGTLLPVAVGAPPTNWSVVNNTNGLAVDISAASTVNNINYTDWHIFGTAVSTNPVQILFETITGIAGAGTGRSYFETAFMEIVGGGNTNITDMSLDLAQYTSGGVALAVISGLNIFSNILTGTLIRINQRNITNSASSAFVVPLFQVTPAVGVVDITIRIGMPQAEFAGIFSSVIATSGAAVTRNGEGMQLNGAAAAALLASAYTVTAATNNCGISSAILGAHLAEYVGFGYVFTNPNFQAVSSLGFSVSRLNETLSNSFSPQSPLIVGLSMSQTDRYMTDSGGSLVGGVTAHDNTYVASGPFFGTSQSKGFPLSGSIQDIDIRNVAVTESQLETLTYRPQTTCLGDSLTDGTGSIYPAINFGYVGNLRAYAGQISAVKMGYPGENAGLIAAHWLADTVHQNDNLVIWVGRNDIGAPVGNVITPITNIINHLAPGNTRFVILSVTNTFGEPSGSANYISIAGFNSAIVQNWPNNYIDVRSAIVVASGGDPGTTDMPAESWVYSNSVHFNDSAYILIGSLVADWGRTHGWLGGYS